MSMYGAGECQLCGAWSDYCTLETPTGVSIDCRNLRLADDMPEDWYRKLAREIREEDWGDDG